MTGALRGRGGALALRDLLRRVGLLQHPVAASRMLSRYGGTQPAAVEIGALRGADRVALVRGEDRVTYGRLRAQMRATAVSLAERWPEGAAVGVEDAATAAGVVLPAAAIAAGLDVVPLGPRLGEADRLAIRRREGLVAVLTAADVRSEPGAVVARRAPGRLRMLSSGSTGVASATVRGGMGVRALVTLADLDRRIGWPRGPVLVLPPLDHGHGLSAVIAGLLRGERMLLASGLPAAELVALARAEEPATVTGVPLQLTRALRAGVFAGERRPRLVVSGSSRLSDEVAGRLQATGARVIDCLGSTEAGTFATRVPPAAFRPLAGVRIEAAADGMLSVDSAMSSGAVRTGDIGAIRRGALVLEGRADGLIDSAGELVSPDRIARELRALPQVRSCWVEVSADELRGAVITARVQVHDAAVTHEHLRDALLPVLGRAGIPRRIEIV